MIRYGREARLLAACLSALAGFVDALGYIALGGFFVSFMSGNTTRLGVGLVQNLGEAGVAAGLVVAFVAGVAAATVAARRARVRARAVLGFVALLLALAAGLHAIGLQAPALVLMASAMGAENAVFERDGEVAVGVTYMTGTLVKLGQRIAGALTGGDGLAWLPYLLLWLGLALGAAAGAGAYAVLGLDALWIAATVAALMALSAPRLAEG